MIDKVRSRILQSKIRKDEALSRHVLDPVRFEGRKMVSKALIG